MHKSEGSVANILFEPLICLVTNFLVCSFSSFAILAQIDLIFRAEETKLLQVGISSSIFQYKCSSVIRDKNGLLIGEMVSYKGLLLT